VRRVALALLLLAAAPASAPILRAEGWTAPSATVEQDLSTAPRECLPRTSDSIETGRALFRSPVLFGGPAARVGLSCEACHAGGRVNAHFLLPELSDAPGTADVTSEWASKVRGDGVRNPVPIPDLVGVARKAAFGAGREPSLEAFVHGVIVEEFQGPEPPRAALDGLLDYLRALDPAACTGEMEPITLASAASDVRRAVGAASAQIERADAPTASLLLYAAQDAIARVVERLPPPLNVDRAALEQLSRELGAARREPAAFDDRPWSARFDGTIARLARVERRTYFNPAVLKRARQMHD
jgi:hypothetical protein